ncbi:MAG: homoserine kinase [Anaerolineales bacterium]|nr:MAG: homoserine kinase [Anaerolineales bacterium]
MKVRVSAPASTANIGPAFDCLALALDLWNEAEFELGGQGLHIHVEGEGAERLPRHERNLVYRAVARVYEEVSQPAPTHIRIRCHNNIPLGSGLGSSAAASLAGLLGANALLGNPLKPELVMRLGAELEGHADNLAAALYGGLVLVKHTEWRTTAQALECAAWQAVYVLPAQRLSTRAARAALPKKVSLADAVFNMGNALAVREALRTGSLPALAEAMQDRLHQPYRLPLLPGAADALAAAQRAGAAAGLSGAGPGLIAFVEPGREQVVLAAMLAALQAHQLAARHFLLRSSTQGAQVSAA